MFDVVGGTNPGGGGRQRPLQDVDDPVDSRNVPLQQQPLVHQFKALGGNHRNHQEKEEHVHVCVWNRIPTQKSTEPAALNYSGRKNHEVWEAVCKVTVKK